MTKATRLPSLLKGFRSWDVYHSRLINFLYLNIISGLGFSRPRLDLGKQKAFLSAPLPHSLPFVPFLPPQKEKKKYSLHTLNLESQDGYCRHGTKRIAKDELGSMSYAINSMNRHWGFFFFFLERRRGTRKIGTCQLGPIVLPLGC